MGDILRDEDVASHPESQAVRHLVAELDVGSDVEQHVMLHQCLHQMTDFDLDGEGMLGGLHLVYVPAHREKMYR